MGKDILTTTEQLSANQKLYVLKSGQQQVREGTKQAQDAAQATVGRWLRKNRPTHVCRVSRLTPKTFAIWIEAR